jgi:DnaJ-class molecular chaperone
MKKETKFLLQFLYPPVEVGCFVDAPVTASAGETNLYSGKTMRKSHRARCCECDGAGKVTIYPLVQIPCHACKGKGYTLELPTRFEIP